jgi:toxin ParE1/3/4
VAKFHFSRRAETDAADIDEYTYRTWGEEQAVAYLNELENCCRLLAGNPKIGHACDEVRSGLRRMECGRHVIFYRKDRGGIVVVRILHQRMIPDRNTMAADGM